MSEHELVPGTFDDVIANMEANVVTVIRLLDLADLASAAFQTGDYARSFEALTDYHALRNEMAQVPFRL